jgi:hypothetical protein
MLLIAENGFVTVFKKVPRTVMAAIIILSIPSEELSHEPGDPWLATSDQKMGVRPHERPRIYGGLRFHDVLPQPAKKTNPILVVFKNRRFVDSPHHDMVKSTGSV